MLLAAVAVHVGEDRADLLPAVRGGADGAGRGARGRVAVHEREGHAQRGVREVALRRVAALRWMSRSRWRTRRDLVGERGRRRGPAARPVRSSTRNGAR